MIDPLEVSYFRSHMLGCRDSARLQSEAYDLLYSAMASPLTDAQFATLHDCLAIIHEHASDFGANEYNMIRKRLRGAGLVTAPREKP